MTDRQPGRTHNIPKLPLFFIISQILPISFATNLLFIAVLLSEEHLVTPKSDLAHLSTVLFQQPHYVVGPPILTFAYWHFTSYIPCALSSQQLISYVLATRFMLAMTYQFTFDLRALEATFSLWMVGFAALKAYLSGSPEHVVFLFGEGKTTDYAVRTLGFDAIILAVSLIMWVIHMYTWVPSRTTKAAVNKR